MTRGEELTHELVVATCALEAAYGTRSADLMAMAKTRHDAASAAVTTAIDGDRG
jgi:hypothetical protein